ncbi:MAG: tRNA epoxyqueuosine(34) reductase QueG, partial [Phycisphaerales bacterium]
MEHPPRHPGPAADTDPAALSRAILARAESLGFALAGVCEARPSDHEEHIRAWLAAGKHGEMDYLADQLAQRLDPGSMLPGVQSVIVVGDLYASRGEGAQRESLPPAHGRVARYARGKDYHKVIKKRLHALCDALRDEHAPHEFRACVDIEPTLEREHAARAGVGWVGRHTLIIHPHAGSYFLLGLILTTLPLVPPPEQQTVSDHCGTCTRCIDACPTDAIAPRGQAPSVDARRCVSYLTLETRGQIPHSFHAGIGDMLAGCDICQEVCPHNSLREGAPPSNPAYSSRLPALPLLDVLHWSPDDRAAALKGTALKRATLSMWKRNAVVAAGNAVGDPQTPASMRDALLERIRELVSDEDDAVRAAAVAALELA